MKLVRTPAPAPVVTVAAVPSTGTSSLFFLNGTTVGDTTVSIADGANNTFGLSVGVVQR